MVEMTMSAQQIPFCFSSGVRFLRTPAFFCQFLVSFFFFREGLRPQAGMGKVVETAEQSKRGDRRGVHVSQL